MNETSLNQSQKVEISLPDGSTYQDLNNAHQKDLEDGGNREENLYPKKQAQLDNAEAYRTEMNLANTRELISQLKSRLNGIKNGDPIEFDDMTGNDNNTKNSLEKRIVKREEEFGKQDEEAAYYIKKIQGLNDKFNIDQWVGFAENSLGRGEITNLQLQEIRGIASNRNSEIKEGIS